MASPDRRKPAPGVLPGKLSPGVLPGKPAPGAEPHSDLVRWHAVSDEGALPASRVGEAVRKYGIDPQKPAPWTV